MSHPSACCWLNGVEEHQRGSGHDSSLRAIAAASWPGVPAEGHNLSGEQPRGLSARFAHIEELQGNRPWGSFLDAGTGTHSISRVSSLATHSWVAVTAATADAIQVRDTVGHA
jgi:hypothetical protein